MLHLATTQDKIGGKNEDKVSYPLYTRMGLHCHPELFLDTL